jgi:hypothetical protein
MRRRLITSFVLLTVMPLVSPTAGSAGRHPREEERTCFQTASNWRPELDAQADVAIVYGPGRSLPERVEQWRSRGYIAHFMTGVAWGNYQDYFGGKFDEREHWAEVQTRRNGSRMPHGRSRDVFYNVPTPAYTEYMKTVVHRAIDTGVRAIHLEEPEYWVAAGYSDAFKEAWQREYGEPWQPPHSSVEARYRSGRLKRKLYTDCLTVLFKDAKAYAAEKGQSIRCYVPTHSLINYAQWRIVSPEGNLMHIDEADGYVAQVWTGTARTPNLYEGRLRERTFETAFLEYGQMVNMVRPTGRRCWLLADPIEDNPDRSWVDYHVNWEATVVASLFRPENAYFEIMPWPSRIFQGERRADDSPGAKRIRIPRDYAAEVMTVTQALGDMKQPDVEWDCGTGGIGVVVSDSMMFERGEPAPADPHLSAFYGLALPLLKHGIPVEVVSLENVVWEDALKPDRVLLLTYENQKPLKPEYHDALVQWIRDGGALVFFDSGPNPFDAIREWWNDGGATSATATRALFEAAGLEAESAEGFHRVDKGWFGIVKRSPRELAGEEGGAQFVCDRVKAALETLGIGENWKTQNHVKIRRGPYVIASVLEESVSPEPLRIGGRFIDLFDPALPVIDEKVLEPGERCLLYDLSKRTGNRPMLLAGSARAYDVEAGESSWSGVLRGPAETDAVLRLWLPREPEKIDIATPESEAVEAQSAWDEASQTLWLRFASSPGGMRCTVR